jgi:hypothetical protein
MSSVTKSVKLPGTLAKALAAAAKRSGRTESDLIREAIERVTGTPDGLDMVALLGEGVGVGRGPKDLSSNRAHMTGYGTSKHR